MSLDKAKAYQLGAIYLYLTDRCNMRCRHCWIYKEDLHQEYTQELTLEQMKEAIVQARPLGLNTIKLTGGEPFVRDDTLAFVDLFRREGLNVDIETNGTLIDDYTAAQLKQLGIRSIAVSLDGAKEEIHDPLRGVDGAYDMALSGIRYLRRHDLNTQIIMSLHRDNASEIEHVALLAVELGVQSLKINPVMPMGRGHKMHQMSRTVPVEELLEMSHWVKRSLSSKINIPMDFSLPIAFQDFREISQEGSPECPVLNILGIVGNGDISFCGIGRLERDLVMGNINRDRLDTLWKDHPLLMEMRSSLPSGLQGICGRCFFKKICLGACRACAYYLDKTLTAPYWFCQEAYEKGLFPITRCMAPPEGNMEHRASYRVQ